MAPLNLNLNLNLSGGTFGDPLAPVLQIENNYHAAHGFFCFYVALLKASFQRAP